MLQKNSGLRFYILPSKKERRKKWLRAINRAEVDESESGKKVDQVNILQKVNILFQFEI